MGLTKKDLTDWLNDKGQRGWELISVVVIGDAPFYYFGRPVYELDERGHPLKGITYPHELGRL